MTESHPPHPSDDDLSAAIDGLDEGGVGAHVAECSRCSYRMEAMRGVSAALAAAPPVDELLRERHISAAVRLRPDTSRRRVWLGAAAAVLVLLVAVPVLLSRGDGNSDQVAGGPSAADQASGDAAASSAAVDDLGAFSDPAALRAALAPRVGEEIIGALRETSGDDAGSATPGAGGGASEAPPTTTTALPPFGQSRTFAGGGGACYQQAEREYGDRVGALLYSANLTWDGQPAVVLVYPLEASQGALDKLALVLRRSDCTLLSSLSM